LAIIAWEKITMAIFLFIYFSGVPIRDCQEFENLKKRKAPPDRLSAEDGYATPIDRIS